MPRPASAPRSEAELRTAGGRTRRDLGIAGRAGLDAGVDQLRRHRRAPQSRGGEHRCDGPRAARAPAGRGRRAPRPGGSVRPRPARRRAAARHRHRLPDRRRRPHPHQPPRDRRRRAAHGEAGRRPHAARRRGRIGSGHRHRADQGPGPGPVPARRAGRFVAAARRRMGLRHRQSAGLRAHRHGRRGQLHRPQAVRSDARQLHPDRRGDQLRQQRRAADQLARPGDRHQLGDQPAGQQHRLRGADQPGARGAAAIEEAGPRRARLHRRHAARRRSGPAVVAEARARRRRAGAGREGRLARRRARACGPTT